MRQFLYTRKSTKKLVWFVNLLFFLVLDLNLAVSFRRRRRRSHSTAATMLQAIRKVETQYKRWKRRMQEEVNRCKRKELNKHANIFLRFLLKLLICFLLLLLLTCTCFALFFFVFFVQLAVVIIVCSCSCCCLLLLF